MKTHKQLNDPINIAIRENEKTVTDWDLSELAKVLYQWTDIFNVTFFKDEPVGVPVISFEKTKTGNLGHYVIGRNAFGVRENININRVHLDRTLWEILATLVHEMCHSWQAAYGSPSNSWFHNREFREKMLVIGISVNEKGCQLGIQEPFVSLLKQHGIEVTGDQNPEGLIQITPKERPRGRSKLKKWTCGCQIVRVGKAGFKATCDICGSQFELVE